LQNGIDEADREQQVDEKVAYGNPEVLGENPIVAPGCGFEEPEVEPVIEVKYGSIYGFQGICNRYYLCSFRLETSGGLSRVGEVTRFVDAFPAFL